MTKNLTPPQLIFRLSVYYGLFIAIVVGMLLADAELLRFMPFGGTDALDRADFEVTETSIRMPRELLTTNTPASEITPESIATSILFLAGTLISAILVMIPVAWSYTATRFEAGYSKAFARALILLPIAAATVVLLIQDSLALAFGLAALVAAVRFRVSLPEAIDGIYVFVAVCVGLAGGIGFMGVALIMTMIFTITNAILWQMDYGNNPIDEARQEAAAAKLKKKIQGQASE